MSDGELFYVVEHGVRWTGMPAWAGEHSDEETWQLVSLIRRLPSLSADDLEMAAPPESRGDAGVSDKEHPGPERHPH